MNETKTLDNLMKGKSKQLIVRLAVLGVAVVVFLGAFIFNKTLPSTHLNDIINEDIENNTASENKHSYIELAGFAELGKYENDTVGSYYLVYDQDYYYIAYFTKKKAKELETEVEDGKTVKIEGVTTKIDSDLKKNLLSSYNKLVNSEYKITNDQFDTTLGALVLKTNKNEPMYITYTYIGAGAVGIIAICFVLGALSNVLKTKKNIKNIPADQREAIERELESCDQEKYRDGNLILTKNYIISYFSGINFLKYEDVLWVYTGTTTNRGSVISYQVYVQTKTGKTQTIASFSSNARGANQLIIEAQDFIASKDKEIIVGNTKENRQKVKEYKQSKKA